MNSYALGLTGSWFLLGLLLTLACIAALFFYRHTIPPILPSKKNVLILLRTLGLWLILFAMFEPILTLISSKNEAPKAIVLIDDSRSMTIESGNLKRNDEVRNFLESFSTFRNIEHFFASFAEKTFITTSPQSLQFKGDATDISQALRWANARSREENIRALVMVTDGNFTTGNNPLYDAEQMGLPLYIVGVGDTIEPKDIAVQPIVTNDYGYVGKSVPVAVSIKSTGYDKLVDVVLFDNNKEISRQTLRLSQSQKNYSLQFSYQPTEKGTRKLTVSVQSQDDELTQKNNTSSEFISIIDFKRKTVIFAGAPSSDVSFIRRILEEEQGSEIKLFIQKQGAQFYDKQPDASSLANAQTIIFIGFPHTTTSPQILSLIAKELEKGKPLLFIAGLTTDYNRLKSIEQYLPFSVLSSRQQEFLVTADIKPSANASSIFQIPETDYQTDIWTQLPPIYKTETFVKAKPDAQILATAMMNGVPLSEPLILTKNTQNSKVLAILGYGLYRWKLLGQAADISKGKTDVIDVLNTFVTNSMQWLTIDNDKKRVTIRAMKRQFSTGERIEFIGQVYDPALSPMDKAYVEVNIKVSNGIKKAILQSIGNGQYAATTEPLPVGDYSFTGSAYVSNELYGSDEGRFSIGENPAEYHSLTMNKQLLTDLAKRTGGKFYLSGESDAMESDIKKHPQFMTNTVQHSDEIPIWNALILLGLALLCFSMEWFIRTRSRLV